ncbi:hypothetical protein C4D60_Mb07t11450 [Musa balbisiana]|uniref:non-specific serine/threonine protein kinase n=1 Tax=Musa balbisiana TaxID=52838 RepID=A0A4S8JGH5_MUSBA|nr:hypothetical protein C4D60_Mb07t11450 [Musa balbisiana]
MVKEGGGEGLRVLGKYVLGRTLGEGNFGKVKYAKHVETGQAFAVKILDRSRVQSLNFSDQIKREIGTLKLLKHPSVVRIHEVSASKTKIYMVLEYVNGGELFDKIALKGRLSEREGRKLFQQLIDAVSYCHDKGVYHRDLKNDGLLHTTCGSPNYVAPEVLKNRGYDGARSDIWSCGVILYVILTGSLPFDDRNLAVLCQKLKVTHQIKSSKFPRISSSLSVAAEVFELSPSLYIVELRKSHGDSSLYRQLCTRLSGDLGVCKSQQHICKALSMPELSSFGGDIIGDGEQGNNKIEYYNVIKK